VSVWFVLTVLILVTLSICIMRGDKKLPPELWDAIIANAVFWCTYFPARL